MTLLSHLEQDQEGGSSQSWDARGQTDARNWERGEETGGEGVNPPPPLTLSLQL